jgi:hypothetical protein
MSLARRGSTTPRPSEGSRAECRAPRRSPAQTLRCGFLLVFRDAGGAEASSPELSLGGPKAIARRKTLGSRACARERRTRCATYPALGHGSRRSAYVSAWTDSRPSRMCSAVTSSTGSRESGLGGESEGRSVARERSSTEADMMAALKAGADAGNAQLKDIEAKCRSGAFRNGNDQALAPDVPRRCDGHRRRRRHSEGHHRLSQSGLRPGARSARLELRLRGAREGVRPQRGSNARRHDEHADGPARRFVYLDNRWVLIE